ncbi:uncharacterized protein MELLADRAFT_124392 [Melampsora larici-populina 98AG31]|uniref:Secreted protein n=1 Tax=Melampsora larici-populina (strain 98AG31 / pathotype 3-4-7) TaxID=747676 RepID=F4RF43_MELLP|nr:uncharacterized protein MELLADRAFT_124392 [Melampsora larici-populina 98AG31]EGG08752.1 secreted protein [Melampsora larici-populina 98AG31]
MLFFKLAIAAILAVTISAIPNQKDVAATDSLMQRRSTTNPVFEKKPSGGDKCTTCDSSECLSISSGCIDLGCCHPRNGVP